MHHAYGVTAKAFYVFDIYHELVEKEDILWIFITNLNHFITTIRSASGAKTLWAPNQGLCPQTPIIGSRYALAIWLPLFKLLDLPVLVLLQYYCSVSVIFKEKQKGHSFYVFRLNYSIGTAIDQHNRRCPTHASRRQPLGTMDYLSVM